MDIEKLIEQLSARGLSNGSSLGYHSGLFDEAATALSTLQDEKEKLYEKIEDARLEGYAKGLGEMSGENEKLRAELKSKVDLVFQQTKELDRKNLLLQEQEAELEQVKKCIEIVEFQRDAAIKDLSELIGDIEEIRCGYGVDNADADEAFADLCGGYCANVDNFCYDKNEYYRCKRFKWRGPHKED